MKCPNCNEVLLMSQRNNIEIDYCPACRGVWLDKGELDKMLEFAEQSNSHEKPGMRMGNQPQNNYNQPGQYGHNKPYKKKSILGELFDF